MRPQCTETLLLVTCFLPLAPCYLFPLFPGSKSLLLAAEGEISVIERPLFIAERPLSVVERPLPAGENRLPVPEIPIQDIRALLQE
jgi:hypothetical protein